MYFSGDQISLPMHRFLSLVRNKCRATFIHFFIFSYFFFKIRKYYVSMNYKRGTLILGDTLIPDSGVDKARFSLKSICLKKKFFA